MKYADACDVDDLKRSSEVSAFIHNLSAHVLGGLWSEFLSPSTPADEVSDDIWRDRSKARKYSEFQGQELIRIMLENIPYLAYRT